MRARLAMLGIALTGLLGLAAAQPPDGDQGDRREPRKKGPPPPRFQLGQTLPPGLRQELNLTEEQSRALDRIESKLREDLQKLFTQEQLRTVENHKPPFPPPPPPREGDGGRPERGDRGDRERFDRPPPPPRDGDRPKERREGRCQ